MASKARKAFDKNIEDVENLIQYYEFADENFRDLNISPPAGADVVLRSAIVMLVTYWEAYVEDIAAEGVAHLVKNTSDPQKLPKDLLKSIAHDLKTDKHELAVWKLAADGWRSLLVKRLPELCVQRNRNFNTPKSAQTSNFLSAALGIADITVCWKFDTKVTKDPCKTLDNLVECRGKIAHRGKLPKTVPVKTVKTLTDWITQLVDMTDGHVNKAVSTCCGVSM